MKFQLGSSIIQESIVLSSKCYSIQTNDGTKSARKGITTDLRHSIYKECLRAETSVKGQLKSIRHFGQSMYHVSTQRTMLSPVETKRYYISANQSLSHGHFMSAIHQDGIDFTNGD